jgi:hypothetical protein
MPFRRRRERACRTWVPRASPAIVMTSSRGVSQDPVSTRYPMSMTVQKNATSIKTTSISHRRNDRMTACLIINQPNLRGRE